MKIVVLSFKNEDRQKDIRDQIQRSPGSIFHEFVIVLEALGVILDVLGSPKLKPSIFLLFSYDWECPKSKSRAKVEAKWWGSGALSNQSSRLQSLKS